MAYLILIPILLLFVAGAVGLFLGRKGVNGKTLVGAWLVLVFTLGFIVFAGLVAERESAGRKRIRELAAEIAEQSGGPLGGKQIFLAGYGAEPTPDQKAERERAKQAIEAVGGSVVDSLSKNIDVVIALTEADSEQIAKDLEKAEELEIKETLDLAAFQEALGESLQGYAETISKLRREQISVETWRNRHWTGNLFKPPKIVPLDDGTGLYGVTEEGTVDFKISGSGEQPLNIGAELAIFAPELGPQLAFLGVFEVKQAEKLQDNVLSVSIMPLTNPDNHDFNAWRLGARENQLLVFEDLPTDRWAADIKPRDGDAAPEQTSLEQAVADLTAGKSLPGEYWARVTVKNADAFEASVFSDDEQPQMQVSEGQEVELDAQTAQALQEDGVVTVEEVVRRRLLTDPLTALRGTRFETNAEGEIPAAGIEGIRRKLSLELASLTLMTDRIGTAHKATESETAAKKKMADDLSDDRDAWLEDLAFAKQALATLEDRDEQTTAALATARKQIAEKREELVKLTTEILAGAKQRATPASGSGSGGRRVAIP